MQLDVVIVTYRSEEHIGACLAALPAKANVIVVENASGDNAVAIAETAGAHVICNDTNAGFGAAANRGAAAGSAELILFLNPDAVVAEPDLESLVKALQADPGLAAVGPRLVNPYGAEQRAWYPFPSPAGRWARLVRLHRLGGEPTSGAERGFVVGACMLVRRVAFASLGGFDRRFWLYGEEADLCRRLWDAGWRVCLVATATAAHIGGASGSSAGSVIFEHRQRGTEHFIAKHHGPGALVVYRLRTLAGALIRLAIRRGDKADYRRAVVRRLTRRLCAHPFTVAPPGEDPTTIGSPENWFPAH